jgi:hypothetical protein
MPEYLVTIEHLITRNVRLKAISLAAAQSEVTAYGWLQASLDYPHTQETQVTRVASVVPAKAVKAASRALYDAIVTRLEEDETSVDGKGMGQ